MPWLARAKQRVYARGYAEKLRRELLTLAGGKCIRCGFDDWRALQLDHVKGDGYKYRKKQRHLALDSKRRVAEKLELIRKKKLQVLCANCNWIKAREQRELNPRR